MKRRYRALSDDQRRQFPQLGLDVSRLEIVAGDFPAALTEPARRRSGLATPCEGRGPPFRLPGRARAPTVGRGARRASEGDRAGCAVCSLSRPWAEVLSILGAGGFGVAFLCRNRYSGGRIVIKAFEDEGIDRDVTDVFREAQILESLRHPGIIRLLDCGFADPVRSSGRFSSWSTSTEHHAR